MKYYVFHRVDSNKWNEQSMKTLAFAETKRWVGGLTDSTTTENKKKKAKSYPMMLLSEKAFKLLNRSMNLKDIWKALEEQYASTEEDDWYELEKNFKRCIMKIFYGNPTDWFNQLDEINSKLSNIDGGKYMKIEDNIKLQIRMNLPDEVNRSVIISFTDYTNMSLKQPSSYT